jgi:hypothetical protein
VDIDNYIIKLSYHRLGATSIVIINYLNIIKYRCAITWCER